MQAAAEALYLSKLVGSTAHAGRMEETMRIRAACDMALEDQGAGVIVLGCTCMQPVAAPLRAAGLPVIEPMTAGYRYTEALLGI